MTQRVPLLAVIVFNNPSGPVMLSPRARAALTSSRRRALGLTRRVLRGLLGRVHAYQCLGHR
jgi:hypothetical protein